MSFQIFYFGYTQRIERIRLFSNIFMYVIDIFLEGFR